MNRVHWWFAVAWFVCLGAGCASAPIHYYTLAAKPDTTSPATQTSPAIEVRVLHLPPRLHRAELMVRTGPSEVVFLENERWASPVADEIEGAVRLELRRRLDRLTGLAPDGKKLTVDIDVQNFEAETEKYALLEAFWSASLSAGGPQSKDAPATICAFHAQEKIRGGYAGMAEGYQRAIAALADDVVAVLTSSAGGIDARCRHSIDGSAVRFGTKDH